HGRQVAQPGAVRQVTGAGRDGCKQQQLPAPREPQRALVRELDEIVEKADRAAAECDEEDRQAGELVLREREKRKRRREQDEDAPRCRGSLLGDMPLRALLADLLAKL